MNFIQFIGRWINIAVSHITTTASAQGVQPTTSQAVAENLHSYPDFFVLIREHISQFIFWGFTSITVIVIVFLVSVVRQFEEWLDPVLHQIKKFAPFIMQITLGSALILSAYHGALFGMDLPLAELFAEYAVFIQWGMYVIGIMLLIGIFPRLAGFLALLLFVPIIYQVGIQTLHHATYLGEASTIFILGGTYELVHSPIHASLRLQRSLRLHLHKYKFALLRFAFGLSVIYASFYTKYLNSSEALSSLTKSEVPTLLSLDPSFILLGLLLAEIVLGIFFIIGFEIRFAAVCYIVIVILSVTLLQEITWPHITLIGTSLAMFTHGYDRYTVGGKFFRRGNLEPVL